VIEHKKKSRRYYHKMKRKLFTALLAGTLIISLSTIAFAGGSIKMFYNGQEIKTDTSPININGRIFAPVRALAEAMGAKVSWDKDSNQVNITGNDQSMQIARLETVLAPKTAVDAVNSWAEGVQTRNGAWQYAVMTPDLRKASYDDFVSMNWSTGTSSPWVKSYEVKEQGKQSDTAYRYSVKFTWTDSTNTTSETTQYITVKYIEGTWLVDSIDNLDVKGKITKVNLAGSKDIESIFVESENKTEATYQQGTAILDSNTKIYRGNTYEELKPDTLKVGTQVEVIFKDGPMIMIYPPQAAAKEIRVF
jgi:hypothetical protein